MSQTAFCKHQINSKNDLIKGSVQHLQHVTVPHINGIHITDTNGNIINGTNGTNNGTKHGENLPEICGSLVYQSTEDATNYLLKRLTGERPTVGIVCGSGLGGLADLLQDTEVFPYSSIPHFPVSTVVGHAGKLVFGKLAGKRIVCMQGRVHLYEGIEPWKVTLPIRVMANLGIKVLIATNAAGALNQEYDVGDVMIIKDHINIPGMGGTNPLIGIHDNRLGARFVPLTDVYDRDLRKQIRMAANALKMNFIREGIYCVQAGPFYETVAECRMLSMLGADAVGMSTAPEVCVARQCGVRCLGLSLITNVCVVDYDTGREPNHAEVIEISQKRALDMQSLVSTIVSMI